MTDSDLTLQQFGTGDFVVLILEDASETPQRFLSQLFLGLSEP